MPSDAVSPGMYQDSVHKATIFLAVPIEKEFAAIQKMESLDCCFYLE